MVRESAIICQSAPHLPLTPAHSTFTVWAQDWHTARVACRELAGLPLLGGAGSAGYYRALLLKERRDYGAALRVVSEQLKNISSASNTGVAGSLEAFQRASLMVLKAELKNAAGRHGEAAVDAVAAVTFAEKYYAGQLGASATALLGEVQLALGLAKEGMETLNAVMPTVLGHGSLEECGKIRLSYGKCIAAVDPSVTGMTRAAKWFGQAEQAFAKLGAKRLRADALYCRTMAFHNASDFEARDSCARLHRLATAVY